MIIWRSLRIIWIWKVIIIGLFYDVLMISVISTIYIIHFNRFTLKLGSDVHFGKNGGEHAAFLLSVIVPGSCIDNLIPIGNGDFETPDQEVRFTKDNYLYCYIDNKEDNYYLDPGIYYYKCCYIPSVEEFMSGNAGFFMADFLPYLSKWV